MLHSSAPDIRWRMTPGGVRRADPMPTGPRGGYRATTATVLDRTNESPDTPFRRAASNALTSAASELDDAPVIMLGADADAHVLDMRGAVPIVSGIEELGVVRGTVLDESAIGINAIGTPIETRTGTFIRGEEHSQAAFHRFACYGQPVIHPITSRLEGVVAVGGAVTGECGYFPHITKQLARAIADQLHADSPVGQRKVLAAFRAAARGERRAVVAIGPGLVLATPAALDLLSPADHAALRACAESGDLSADSEMTMPLLSGESVRLRSRAIDGTDGTLLDLHLDSAPPRADLRLVESWPILIVGETGSGRSTEARRVTGAGARTVDAADIVRSGSDSWTNSVAALLESPGEPIVVENVQLLPDDVTVVLANFISRSERRVAITSTPGDHLAGPHAPLAVVCDTRTELLPLRRRSTEIPQLAQRLLADLAPLSNLRFTSDTLQLLSEQSWPGNLTELRRVIDGVVRRRPRGDILPDDLPAPYRVRSAPTSPFRRAEREVIVDAIEAAGGNKRQAAIDLGVSRSTLYNRMRALNIS